MLRAGIEPVLLPSEGSIVSIQLRGPHTHSLQTIQILEFSCQARVSPHILIFSFAREFVPEI